MTYVVTEACIKCKHMDCIEVCPVDCFYEGENMLVIHPDECIDCGVCEPECPPKAIVPDSDPQADKWLKLNTEFAVKWPNITRKGTPPPDADDWKEVPDKYAKYFTPNPGKGSSSVQLTSEEQSILGGGRGEPARRALAYQVEVGRFWGAKRFVPVTNVHMMGDIEVMGDAGLEFLRNEVEQSARCAVPTTTNARCMDFAHCERMGQDAGEAVKEKELIAALRRMDVVTTDTCINYQTVYQPHLGEHVAWGDTGTVIYANSVFGARSNFEAGPAALAAALTGRTPEYGFHLSEKRIGTFTVELKARLDDLADWGAVGKRVGESHQNYYAVPVFHGYHRTPGADELKHLGAALASYGSMGMFHFVGVTPEAPSIDVAMGGVSSYERLLIEEKDIENTFRNYQLGDGDARLVVFSGPQQSLFEMKHLSSLFENRRIKPGATCIVTTNSAILKQSRDLGYAKALEEAGVTILEGVCFYILQNLSPMREKNRWTNMVSNSAKIVNIIGAHRFNTILRRTADCVEIACTGVLK